MLKDAPSVIERYQRAQEEAQNTKNKPKTSGPEESLPEAEEPYFEDDKVALDEGDYNFYENNSFDPFIATLTKEERNEFTEVFILKFKGNIDNLPDYEVGGKNQEFFHSFLENYQDFTNKLSVPLLMKMHQYSTKIE